MNNYNPLDLIAVSINGEIVNARPTKLSADIVYSDQMLDAFGNIVKPVEVETTCPKCGSLISAVVELDDPPFSVVDVICDSCYANNVVDEPDDDIIIRDEDSMRTSESTVNRRVDNYVDVDMRSDGATMLPLDVIGDEEIKDIDIFSDEDDEI